MARDALGGEGAATVDVTLVQTSMAGAALRNYTRWAFDVAFALARPEQALQVAVCVEIKILRRVLVHPTH